jgi:rubrerythrin
MKKLSSMSDVLDFAIAGESKAAELYTKMAATAEKLDDAEPQLQETFLALAEQEAEHKRRFEMEYESLTS